MTTKSLTAIIAPAFVVLAALSWIAVSAYRDSQRKTQRHARISQLLRGFEAEDPGKRWAALGKLSTYGGDAVPGLQQALQDVNPDVRWSAAGALALIGPPAKEALSYGNQNNETSKQNSSSL